MYVSVSSHALCISEQLTSSYVELNIDGKYHLHPDSDFLGFL